jgi:hypothetical protein
MYTVVDNYPNKTKIHQVNNHGEYTYTVNGVEIRSTISLYLYFDHVIGGDTPEEFSHEHLTEIKRICGIIPFCYWIREYRKGVSVFEYIPNIEYNTLEELELRRKPIEMIEFIDIQIPKAIYNKMKFVKKMTADTGECCITLEDFPEKIREHVLTAITKLSHVSRCKDCMLEDMAVYDFLEVLSIFRYDGLWFINGDKLIQHTMVNLIKSGLFKCDKLAYVFDKTIDKPHELLTDTIAEVHESYFDMVYNLKNMHSNLKYMDFRALKIIGERGHL